MATEFDTTPSTTPSETALQQLATSPQRIRTDEGTVEERSGSELIALDAYTDPNNLATGQTFGLDIRRAKPGSALGGRPIQIR
jgi:hypothetical protein